MCVDNLTLLSFLLSKCPWLLVANDENGGVFAQVVGTKMCVSKRDWALCAGVIVNKVKSEIKEFLLGLQMLEQMTGKPLYAMPFIDDLDAHNEIAIDIERRLTWEKGGYSKRDHQYEANRLNRLKREKPSVVVVAYPHTTISNDLYPLEKDSRFHLEWRRRRLPKPYPATTAVILPGSRLPLLDLKWLRVSFSLDFSL
jgi:cobyric acid synthase